MAVSGDAVFVFALIAVAALAMASNRVRYDVVALLVVLSLMLSGVLSVGQALAGFGSSVVVMVAALLVVGEMLDRTGVARAVGDWILNKGGGNETLLLVLIMLGAAGLSAVMSSTAVVAIFIPIVLRIAAETSVNASRMLIPMSYAALISGMLTLIATPPNIVVNEELKAAGYAGFGFFSFAPVGLLVLVVAILYVLLFARNMIGKRAPQSAQRPRGRSIMALWEDFRVDRVVDTLSIQTGSVLVGKRLADSGMESLCGARILGLRRRGRGGEEVTITPGPEVEFRSGDILLITRRTQVDAALPGELGIAPVQGSARDRQRWLWEMGAASVLVHPDSGLIGKSVREAEFRAHYGLEVVGLRRARKPVGDFEDERLAPSDGLLVAGPWERIQMLKSQTHDFVVLELPSEHADIVPSYRRMPMALGILAAMVLLTLFDLVPLVAAVLMAAMAAVLTRSLTAEDAYRSINWSNLVLIAGMLPLADALERTGGTQIIVEALMTAVGESSPYVMLSALFFLTATVGLVLSNTASAVLVAPIAIYAASALGVSPYPFAVAVLVAASAAYSTPVSTPVVTLVVEPGRYSFMDFVKAGVPLLLLTYLVTLVVAPLIFPFN
jgi:di/tricarboxylate transporter